MPSFGIDDLEGFATEVLNAATEIRLGDSPLASTIGTDESVVNCWRSKAPNDGAANRSSTWAGTRWRGLGEFVLLLHDRANSANRTIRDSVERANLEAAQIIPLQYHIRSKDWFRPMRQRWNRDAVAFGSYRCNCPPKEMLPKTSQVGGSNVDCIGAGRFLIEPDGETNASLTMMRSSLSSLKYEAGKMGQGLEEVYLRDMSIVNEHCASILGVITLDFSKGNGGQATK
jgi:hypothetical protein